jgi:DNA-binding MarR family transcriptional regulator
MVEEYHFILHAYYTAHIKYGYSLKEIAGYLMVYYNTVSRMIKKFEREEDGEISRH